MSYFNFIWILMLFIKYGKFIFIRYGYCMHGSRGGQGVPGPHPPLENDKNIGFLSNTGPNSPQSHSYLARVQR